MKRFVSAPALGGALGLLVVAIVVLAATGRLAVRWSGVAPSAPSREPARLPAADGQLTLDEATLSTSDVKVETVSPGRIPLGLTLAGEVELAQGRFSHVTPRLSGAVRELLVEVGAAVSSGTTLCTLESVELGEARAALVAAIAERAIAERNFERWKQLFEKGLRTQNEFWLAENQLTRARLAVDAQASRLKAFGIDDAEIAELEHADRRAVTNRFAVRSPLTGVVIDRRATLGEFVAPQDHLFLVADLSTVWVVAALHQRDLGSVRRGMPARVMVGGSGEYPGVVTYVGQQVDERTRTVPLRVSVDNALLTGANEYALRPAMFATVELATGEREARVVVPRSALQRFGGETIVFACTRRGGGKAVFERRSVVTGASDGQRIEVVSGVAPGEQIATENAHLLASVLRGPQGHGAD